MSGVLVFVTATDCHVCEHGRPIVARLAAATNTTVRELDWDEREAQDLIRRHGVPFPPALYSDDGLLGFGRLSERRLRKLMQVVPA